MRSQYWIVLILKLYVHVIYLQDESSVSTYVNVIYDIKYVDIICITNTRHQ